MSEIYRSSKLPPAKPLQIPEALQRAVDETPTIGIGFRNTKSLPPLPQTTERVVVEEVPAPRRRAVQKKDDSQRERYESMTVRELREELRAVAESRGVSMSSIVGTTSPTKQQLIDALLR
jgi:hypothetical protein